MPAPMGNSNRAGAAAINRVLMDAVRDERFDLLRKGVKAQLRKASEGDLNSLAWIFDRIVGRAVAQVEVGAADAREIDLTSIMRLVMQARSASAEDAVPRETTALPSDTPPGIPDPT